MLQLVTHKGEGMAKKDLKTKYQGPKYAHDTSTFRQENEKRRQRAETNAQQKQTNEIFALQDTAFKQFCEKAGVQPTARQASKFRQPAPYGAAARAAGRNKRQDPRA